MYIGLQSTARLSEILALNYKAILESMPIIDKIPSFKNKKYVAVLIGTLMPSSMSNEQIIDAYNRFISKVLLEFTCQKDQLLLLLHPRESQHMIDLIKNTIKIESINPKHYYCAEQIILTVKPINVLSFHSTTTINTFYLFPHTNAFFYDDRLYLNNTKSLQAASSVGIRIIK